MQATRRSRMRVASVAALATLCSSPAVLAHPMCADGTAPISSNSLQFCSTLKADNQGTCCNASEELQLKSNRYDIFDGLSEQCQGFQQQIACGRCSPYEAHLFADSDQADPFQDAGFCAAYVEACKDSIDLPADYCSKYPPTDSWSYPVNEASAPGTLKPYFKNLQAKLPPAMVGMYPRPGTDKWWIVNQTGQVYEVVNSPDAGSLELIMDISKEVNPNYGEMGLLGLAFSPDFTRSNKFYVNYIDRTSGKHNTVIARYSYVPGNSAATSSTEVRLLKFQQPYENHNGGTLLFSPADINNPDADAFDLYITTGDGGAGNDPGNRSQNLDSNFGKILRMRLNKKDYDNAKYDIPEDNLRGLVWAYGLRNPWKCSFDRIKDAEMWCGNVGENAIESVVQVTAGSNMGWRNYEGTRPNLGSSFTYTLPVYQYCHASDSDPSLCAGKPFTGQSITGGFIYRGKKLADQYAGQYIFADWQANTVMRLDPSTGKAEVIASAGGHVPSLAEDSDGELYIITYGEEKNVFALPDAPTDSTVPAASLTASLKKPAASSSPDPTCSGGLTGAFGACCPITCLSCSGNGCESKPGGRSSCCSTGIAKTKRSCTDTGAPCIMNGDAA